MGSEGTWGLDLENGHHRACKWIGTHSVLLTVVLIAWCVDTEEEMVRSLHLPSSFAPTVSRRAEYESWCPWPAVRFWGCRAWLWGAQGVELGYGTDGWWLWEVFSYLLPWTNVHSMIFLIFSFTGRTLNLQSHSQACQPVAGGGEWSTVSLGVIVWHAENWEEHFATCVTYPANEGSSLFKISLNFTWQVYFG